MQPGSDRILPAWTSQLLYAWCYYPSWLMWRCHPVSGWSAFVTRCCGPRCSIITTGGEDRAASSGLGASSLGGFRNRRGTTHSYRGGYLRRFKGLTSVWLHSFLVWEDKHVHLTLPIKCSPGQLSTAAAQHFRSLLFWLSLSCLIIQVLYLLGTTTGTYRSRTPCGLLSSGLKGKVPSGQENRW